MVEYFALYQATDVSNGNEDGHDYICVGLFGAEELLEELKVNHRLEEHRALLIEPGSMSQEEWDALEEVPDDFVPNGSPA